MGRTTRRLRKLYIDYLLRKESNHYLRKINHMPVNTRCKIEEGVIKKYRENWSPLIQKKVSLRWLQWYISCNGIQSPDYVPENVYYTIIEPILNERKFSAGYADKNFYDLIYPRGLFPETIVRNIGGNYFNRNYELLQIRNPGDLNNVVGQNGNLIVKPAIDSGGGNKVDLFEHNGNNYINEENKILTPEYLNEFYKRDFLIQKGMRNHPFLEQFNKKSLNTIRVTVVRNPVTNQMGFINSYLRVGGQSSHLDNMRSGGYAIGIDSKGVLMPYAVKKKGETTTIVNGTDLSVGTYTVPNLDKFYETAREIAAKNIHHKILGLDMTLDDNCNIRCIEVNNESIGINHMQLTGGPLLGNLTEAIIDYCLRHRDTLYKR
jgi:Sugar-transfer associated ATP-grasp